MTKIGPSTNSSEVPLSKYSGILGYVGVPTIDGRIIANLTFREFPMPVFGLDDNPNKNSRTIGKLTKVWIDRIGRVCAEAELWKTEKLLVGGMDLDSIGYLEEWEITGRLMWFTVYPSIDVGLLGAMKPAWPGVHLLRHE